MQLQLAAFERLERLPIGNNFATEMAPLKYSILLSSVPLIRVVGTTGVLPDTGTESRTASGDAVLVLTNDKLALYPNPSSNATNVSFTLGTDNVVSLDAFDMNGRNVDHVLDGIEYAAGEHSLSVDVGSWAEGVYTFRLSTNTASYTRRVAVRR